MKTLLLASSSMYRKELLQRLMIPFSTANPDIDETPLENESPENLVQRLAIEKSKAISAKNALIIGSDQVALHGEQIIGKPITHKNAVKQLQSASGKTIQLYTGLALHNTQTHETQSIVIPFTVHFHTLRAQQIENYLRKEKPYDCAGSVKSEGLGISLISRFEGDDPTALIGLPLIALTRMLEKANFPLY